MYIDLHTHIKLLRNMDFDINHFDKFVKVSKRRGLNAIVATVHFDTKDFYKIYDTIKEKYEYKNDYFDIDGFKVFSGIEVDVKGDANVLVIGSLDDVIKIRQLFPEKITKEDYITINELTRIAREKDMLLIGAHPFRKNNKLYTYDRLYVTGLDSVELNGTDIKLKEKMYEYAEDLNMPLTAGSDAHTIYQIRNC